MLSRDSSHNTPAKPPQSNPPEVQESASATSLTPPQNPSIPTVTPPTTLLQQSSACSVSSNAPSPTANSHPPTYPHAQSPFPIGMTFQQGALIPPATVPGNAMPSNLDPASMVSSVPSSGTAGLSSIHTQYGPHLSYMESQMAAQALLLDQQRRIQQLERELASSRREILRLKTANREKSCASDASSRANSQGACDTSIEKKTSSRYWTNEEHKKFLEGLEIYGQKDIKSIAKHVGTRSATQVRTHAQKYYLRLQREKRKQEKVEQDVGKSASQQPALTVMNGRPHGTNPVLPSAPTVPGWVNPSIKASMTTSVASMKSPSAVSAPPANTHSVPKLFSKPDSYGENISNTSSGPCTRDTGPARGSHLASQKDMRAQDATVIKRELEMPAVAKVRRPVRYKRSRTNQEANSHTCSERKRHQNDQRQSSPTRNDAVPLSDSTTLKKQDREVVKQEIEICPRTGGERKGGTEAEAPDTSQKKTNSSNMAERKVIKVGNPLAQDGLSGGLKSSATLKRLANPSPMMSDLSKGVFKPLSRTNSLLLGGRELRRSNSILSLLSGVPSALRESSSTDRLSNLLSLEMQEERPASFLRSFDLSGSVGTFPSATARDRSLSFIHLNLLSDESESIAMHGLKDTDWT